VSATHGTLNVGAASLNSPPITDMVAGSFHTGRLPEGLQGSLHQLVGRQTYDLALLAYADPAYMGMAAIDQDAEIVWYYEQEEGVFAIAQKDNHSLVFNNIPGGRMREIQPDGTVIHEVVDEMDGTICAPFGRWHHEMKIIPGNRVLTLGSEIREIDDPLTNGAVLITGDTIEIWDIDAGTVTRIFSEFDVLDPIADQILINPEQRFFWRGCDGSVPSEDWTHSNSLWVMDDGNILISMRQLNQLIAIDPDSGQLVWRLGGPGSDFAFPDASDEFHFQHSAKQLPNGNILLFDNGNLRPEEDGGEYSRALELELDMVNMTASKVWEYRYTPDLFAVCCSNVTRLDNGNTVVMFGFGEFHLVEVDSNDNIVSDVLMDSPGKITQYRADPLDTINGESKVTLP
jgi:hypothetical protein